MIKLHRIPERPAFERLRALPLFAGCTTEELAFIDHRLCEHHAPAGEVLARQGGLASEFVVIVDGLAEVTIGERLVAVVGPGDFLGETALLDHGTRTATVVAVTDLDALVANPREFAEIVAEVPSVARRLLTTVAARLRRADLALAS